jgi:predicted nuclease with TOPRIM domain
VYLKYRFGWKSSDKIHYYSELLGMKDTISEEDLLVDTTKTEIEQRLLQSEKKNEILQDRIASMEKEIQKITEVTNKLHMEVITN